MIEIKNRNKSFRLKVLKKEFDSSEFDEDLQWLVVQIEAKEDANFWKASGPYLRITELDEIVDWLVNITEKKIEERLSFLENELSFEYNYSNSELSVILDFNFHPKGEHYDYGVDKEYELNFKVSESEIKKIILSLKKSISTFDEHIQ